MTFERTASFIAISIVAVGTGWGLGAHVREAFGYGCVSFLFLLLIQKLWDVLEEDFQ